MRAQHDLRVIGNMDELRATIHTADALYVRPPAIADRALLERATRLRVVATSGAGLDHIDVETATRLGIAVVNVRGIGAVAVAEHTVALALALAKRIVWADARTRQGEFSIRYGPGFEELSGKTAALIGFGNIGRAVAHRLGLGLGMRIVVYERHPTHDQPVPGIEVVRVATLDDALAQADLVSLHTPLTTQTHHLIGANQLRQMKPGAWLINTARGGVVDERALVDALRRGVIAGAGIDVFEHEPAPADNPLFGLDNVIVTPHLAGLNRQTSQRLTRSAAQDMCSVLAGRRPAGLVNPTACNFTETSE